MKFKRLYKNFSNRWIRFWMRQASVTNFGRFSMRLAAWLVPPYKDRIPLSYKNNNGFIESTAIINHSDLSFGKNCFIGDRVIIFEKTKGGKVKLGNKVEILRDTTLETGPGGQITIGDHSSIHPGGHLYSFAENIEIGSGVMIAPACALYSYDHGIHPNGIIRKQPVQSKGPVIIDDEAWLGVRVTVLSGVRIGKGAVIGAGSVVSKNIPDNAIAVGTPARVVKMRSDII